MHCPKNNLNFRIKTEPVTVDAHSTDNLFFLAQMYEYLHVRCICSSSDRPGFYAKIQLIFGIAWPIDHWPVFTLFLKQCTYIISLLFYVGTIQVLTFLNLSLHNSAQYAENLPRRSSGIRTWDAANTLNYPRYMNITVYQMVINT